MTRWRRIYYLIPVVALVIPYFANEYLLWVVNAILVYTLVTVGFNLIIGNLGQLAFANTAFFGIGAYTTAILMVYFGDSTNSYDPSPHPNQTIVIWSHR